MPQARGGPTTTSTDRSLKSKILNAGGWTILVTAFIQITRLLTSLVMTRLLAPDAFGVMAIAIVVNTGLTLFSDVGLYQSVVRSSRGNDPLFLNTLWMIQIARGFFIWALALIIALVLYLLQSVDFATPTSTYGHPSLPYVIAVVGFTAVIAGLESTKVAIAKRELAIGKLSRVEILGNITAVTVTVGWGLLEPTIWALVGGWIAGALTRTILTYIMLDGMPNRPHWDSAAFQEIFHYGKWIALSSMLGFMLMNGDRILLGGLVTPEILGLYAIAFSLISVAQQTSSRLMTSVVFPALSEVIRNRPANLKSAYYRMKVPLDSAFLLASGGLFSMGPLVVDWLYDPRYSGAGEILQILALTLFTARYEISEQCYLALGKPRLLTILNTIRVAVLYALIPAGFAAFGLYGAIWAVVVGLGSAIPFSLYFNYKNGILDIGKELMVLLAFPAGIIAGHALSAFVGR